MSFFVFYINFIYKSTVVSTGFPVIGPLPPRIPFFLLRSSGPSPRTVPLHTSTRRQEPPPDPFKLPPGTVPMHASAPRPEPMLAFFKMLARAVPMRPITAKAAVVHAASQSWMVDFLFLKVRGNGLWIQYSVVVVVLVVAQLAAASSE